MELTPSQVAVFEHSAVRVVHVTLCDPRGRGVARLRHAGSAGSLPAMMDALGDLAFSVEFRLPSLPIMSPFALNFELQRDSRIDPSQLALFDVPAGG